MKVEHCVWYFPFISIQLSRWASFLIEYQICLENSSIPCLNNRQKVEQIRPKTAFPHHFGRPPRCPPFLQPDFQ